MKIKTKSVFVFSAIILLLVVYLAKRYFQINYGKIDYDQWNIDNNGEMGYRLQIADRIVAQNAMLGLSRIEVLKRLGINESTEYFKDYDLIYRLGNERGFMGIDSEWLGIKFSDNKVVVTNILKD